MNSFAEQFESEFYWIWWSPHCLSGDAVLRTGMASWRSSHRTHVAKTAEYVIRCRPVNWFLVRNWMEILRKYPLNVIAAKNTQHRAQLRQTRIIWPHKRWDFHFYLILSENICFYGFKNEMMCSRSCMFFHILIYYHSVTGFVVLFHIVRFNTLVSVWVILDITLHVQFQRQLKCIHKYLHEISSQFTHVLHGPTGTTQCEWECFCFSLVVCCLFSFGEISDSSES